MNQPGSRFIKALLASLLLVLFCVSSPACAATDPGLLQYTVPNGHVLGFGTGHIYAGTGSHMLKIELVGVGNAAPVAADNASAQAESGKAPPFTKVTYPDAWKGVTVEYANTVGMVMKSTYHIKAAAPDKAAEQIHLRYNRSLQLDKKGNLVIKFETGQMTEAAPTAWQETPKGKKKVRVAWALKGERDAVFKIGKYDRCLPLVIDPALAWHTFEIFKLFQQ